MLFASLASVMCGYDSYVAFAKFTELNLKWLRSAGCLFANGAPSHDAFRYAFSVVDHGLFSACLRNISDILRSKAGKGNVSIDGKALRRCMNRGGKTPYIVNAWADADGIVLGEVKVDEKSNEITAIPEILRLLGLEGCIVTIDAAGCQKNIMRQVVRDCRADAVLALKDNQKTFHEEMLLLFEKELVASPHLFAKYEAPAEKNSGRIEKRTCWQTDYIGWFENIDEWYGLRSVIMVEAEIIHAMCKCASVEAPNGQSSAPVPVSERKAGAGNWCRPLMHLHICTLAHSKESPAGAGADKARGGQPRVNPKDGALADRAVGEATEVRDQGREDVRGSVKGSEAGNADSVAHERRSPAPAFSTRLSLALGLPTSPWVVGARIIRNS
jgi:predicted transposase YbfD/YdcC